MRHSLARWLLTASLLASTQASADRDHRHDRQGRQSERHCPDQRRRTERHEPKQRIHVRGKLFVDQDIVRIGKAVSRHELEANPTLVDAVLPMLKPYEFTLYLLLLRATEFKGGKGTRSSQGNYQHITEKLNGLADAGFIAVGDTSQEGTQYRVLLPEAVPAGPSLQGVGARAITLMPTLWSWLRPVTVCVRP